MKRKSESKPKYMKLKTKIHHAFIDLTCRGFYIAHYNKKYIEEIATEYEMFVLETFSDIGTEDI